MVSRRGHQHTKAPLQRDSLNNASGPKATFARADEAPVACEMQCNTRGLFPAAPRHPEGNKSREGQGPVSRPRRDAHINQTEMNFL
ncbi:hypothetical protein EVAR_2299_1 [Eumeta japonica]|uniref:Uncharacterized protein n=1 Tax=Eumeta variegata TaxID=151549 RepID=A0A4C1SIQ9_EUMVA|nr:hypothetical protein EVAR_2299_1 [Eumeta japonica]